MNEPRRYEVMFSGRDLSGRYKHYTTRIITAHDAVSAEVKLLKEFKTITIHNQGVISNDN